ncbi:hypothetical protein ACFWNG_04935 [Streptomyces sp. NPDC058391]|uniref:hypothetical protein n=1 Tax=Streptomyces sp. NPDC058391 TaxID=3346476 RepID=UPI00365725C7
MTAGVGVITGDPVLATTPEPDDHSSVRLQYTRTEEWYTLTGSPTPDGRAGCTPCTPQSSKPYDTAARPSFPPTESPDVLFSVTADRRDEKVTGRQRCCWARTAMKLTAPVPVP